MAPMIGPSRSLLLAVAVLGAAACAGGPSPSASPAAVRTATEGIVGQTAWRAPAGFEGAGGSWFRVVSGGLDLLVVLQSPGGAAPFPLVVYLPGEAGLAASEVRWAGGLAAAGYLVVMGWPPANGGRECQPRAPSASGLDDLIGMAEIQHAARRPPIGVIAISAGAAVALAAAADRTDLGALVADSTTSRCRRPSRAPVLLLAGQDDGAFPNSQQCATALAGSESQFFPGGGHLVTLSADTGDAATARVIEFLDRHLK